MADCEEFAEMLSAWIDGELEQGELSRLEKHLETCQACQDLKRRLEAVDRLAIKHSGPPESREMKPSFNIEPAKKSESGWRRLTSLAVAALVLIAVSLVIIATGDRAEARRSAAENLTALKVTNQEAAQGQEAVLKSFIWDLNAMKMDVCYSDLEGENAQSLLNRIDALLDEVNRIREEEPADENRQTNRPFDATAIQGEEP